MTDRMTFTALGQDFTAEAFDDDLITVRMIVPDELEKPGCCDASATVQRMATGWALGANQHGDLNSALSEAAILIILQHRRQSKRLTAADALAQEADAEIIRLNSLFAIKDLCEAQDED